MQGAALSTSFVLQCSGWTGDVNLYPLVYAFAAFREDGTAVDLSASRNTSLQQVTVRLRAGTYCLLTSHE